MVLYELKIHDKEVNEWGAEGEGAYIQTAQLGIVEQFDTLPLSLSAITGAINDTLALNIKEDLLDFSNDQCGMFSVIENADGVQDDNGEYISRYSFTVRKVSPFLDLQKLYEGGELK